MNSETVERKNDREIAVEKDITEEAVKTERRQSGYPRLSDFISQEEVENAKKVEFELDELRKRQLQGFIGEKITGLMVNRLKGELEEYVKDDWVLRDKAQILSEKNNGYMLRIGGRPGNDEIMVERNTVKHMGAEEKMIREKARKETFLMSHQMFERYSEMKNPWIDQNFYALEVNGSKTVKFTVKDYSKESFERTSHLEVKIPYVTDFKIIAVEIKTSKDEANNLLSKNQRKVRDNSKESPHLDFFTLKLDTEFEEFGLPGTFEAQIERTQKNTDPTN